MTAPNPQKTELLVLELEKRKLTDAERAALAEQLLADRGELGDSGELHTALPQVAARDEEIATLRARVEDWAAQYRALSARVESERAGLRHSLAEVEDERDEAVSAMAEWRARAEVAEPDRDRLREGVARVLKELREVPHTCATHQHLPCGGCNVGFASGGLRALLGEAKEGGAL